MSYLCLALYVLGFVNTYYLGRAIRYRPYDPKATIRIAILWPVVAVSMLIAGEDIVEEKK